MSTNSEPAAAAVPAAVAANEGGAAVADAVGEEPVDETNKNPVVFFDVDISGDYAGRIEIMLYADAVPKTAENFLKLCTHENDVPPSKNGLKPGKPVGFRRSQFHHAQKGFCAAGDYTRDQAGASAFEGERFFPQENFTMPHDRAGIVTMISSTLPAEPEPQIVNGSLFMIMAKAAPKLDGRQVVVGVVTHGLEVVERICAECAFQPPDTIGTSKTVTIVECGRLA